MADNEQKPHDLAKLVAQAPINLFTAYKDIHDRAVAGEEITADDFNRPETIYNKQLSEIQKEFAKLLPEEQGVINSEIQKIMADWEKVNPEAIKAIKDNEPLAKTFSSQYVDTEFSPTTWFHPSKNLELSSDTDTQQELITDLLSKNAGIAVGDAHSKSASMPFIYDNIKTFKAAGGDTIYLEMSSADFEVFSKILKKEHQNKKKLKEK